MVTKAAPRLAPAVAGFLEAELRNLPTTRGMLEDADQGRLGRFGQTYAAELSRLLHMRAFVAAVDAMTPTFNDEAAAVFQALYANHGRIDDAATRAGVSSRTAQRIREAILVTVASRLGMVSV
jgi:hypothetical protein